MRDLASGQLGEVIAADRDAVNRWERYRVRLADAREVFRSDRELELAPTILVSLLFVLLFAGAAAAQAAASIGWGYDSPIAEIATYTQAAFVDGVPTTGVIACAAVPGDPTKTACSVTTAPIGPGKHTLRVDATKNGSTTTTIVQNFDPANTPKNASTPRYTLTITVTLP